MEIKVEHVGDETESSASPKAFRRSSRRIRGLPSPGENQRRDDERRALDSTSKLSRDRIQQPPVYINPGLMKVKMACDYIPQKKENPPENTDPEESSNAPETLDEPVSKKKRRTEDEIATKNSTANMQCFVSLERIELAPSAVSPKSFDTNVVHIVELGNKKPKITVSTLPGKIPEFGCQSVEELCNKLEPLEEGTDEIRLEVFRVDMTSEEQELLVYKFGKVICSLTLGYGALAKMSRPATFFTLLSKLPNLTHLTLVTIPTKWKVQNKPFVTDLQFPNVETIDFGASLEFYPGFLKGLFETLPNLTRIQNFPLYCIDLFTADFGLHLDKIRSINFSWIRVNQKLERELSQLANLSQTMRLKTAHFSFKMTMSQSSEAIWKSCCKSLGTILQNNSSTIETLKIEPLPNRPEFLEYPIMDQVTSICLINSIDWRKCEHAAKEMSFFGAIFDPQTTFPNLREVTLEGSNCSLDGLLQFFPREFSGVQQNRFGGVTSLKMYCRYAEEVEALEKVARIFPSVTRFSLDDRYATNMDHLTQMFGMWPKLTSLTFRVIIPPANKVVAKYLLDSVFTGIPEAKCAELRGHEEKMDIDLTNYRENLAISSITGLKELTLVFDGHFGKTQKIVPFFSHVTPFYGFQGLPDLKVTCAIPGANKDSLKIQEMLSPIARYVAMDTFWVDNCTV